MKRRTTAVGGGLVLTVAAPALRAHGLAADGAGFTAGLAHPFLGLDHLLALLAVGLWAAQQHGRTQWAIPALFVAVMAAGALAGVNGIAVPGVEAGIAASVLALGLLVAGRVRGPVPLGIALVAGFAFVHGHAHGAEMPQAASVARYALGMASATAALHGAGFLLGNRLQRFLGEIPVRAGGAAIAAAGALAWIAG